MRGVIFAMACLLSAGQRQAHAPDSSEALAMLLLANNPAAGWQAPTHKALSSRRQALAQGAALLSSIAAATPAFAKNRWTVEDDELFTDRPRVGAGLNDIPDEEVPPSQLGIPGKIDVNNAPITDYKFLPGMFPRAAGQIASNGPYQSVSDLYEIETATEADKKLFKKYASDLVALPPGRMFVERLNGRQST